MASQTQTELMQRGRVVWWKPERGYGFIRPDNGRDDGKDDLFVHWSGIDSAHHPKNLLAEQLVEFEVSIGSKGKFASRVKVVVP